MRSPSPRVLINRADIYLALPGRDPEGGVQFPYPATPTLSHVPCTAQAVSFFEETSEDGRITQITEWKVMFGEFVDVSPRDKMVVTNATGTHTMFVEADRDEASRAAAFTVKAIEKV